MDWAGQQAKPRSFVSGPAKIRIVKMVREVALEVTREQRAQNLFKR
jgi:hypothetical protein